MWGGVRISTFLTNIVIKSSQSSLPPFSLSVHPGVPVHLVMASFIVTFLPLSFPFNQKIFLNQSSLVHFHIVHSRDQGTGTISCGGASRALKVKVSCWRRQWQLSTLGFISDGVSLLRFTSATHPVFKSLPLSLFIRIHYCYWIRTDGLPQEIDFGNMLDLHCSEHQSIWKHTPDEDLI